ncbi:MAG: hypothetical protein ACREMI_09115 [Gemmatimonadales bacterium]
MKSMLIVAAILATPGLAAQQAPAPPVPGDSADTRASLFVRRGCADCHAIAALKVKAKSDVGPDLTLTYAEVQTRYGITLERFFDDPPGIMRVIFGSQIKLERAESDSLVRLFRDLYTEHLAQLDSLNRRAGRSWASEPHR